MNPQLPPREFLEEFILEQIPAQPIEKQIFIYRALSAVSTNSILKNATAILADDLERIEERHRQLFLDFQAQRPSDRTDSQPDSEDRDNSRDGEPPKQEDV